MLKQSLLDKANELELTYSAMLYKTDPNSWVEYVISRKGWK